MRQRPPCRSPQETSASSSSTRGSTSGPCAATAATPNASPAVHPAKPASPAPASRYARSRRRASVTPGRPGLPMGEASRSPARRASAEEHSPASSCSMAKARRSGSCTRHTRFPSASWPTAPRTTRSGRRTRSACRSSLPEARARDSASSSSGQATATPTKLPPTRRSTTSGRRTAGTSWSIAAGSCCSTTPATARHATSTPTRSATAFRRSARTASASPTSSRRAARAGSSRRNRMGQTASP